MEVDALHRGWKDAKPPSLSSETRKGHWSGEDSTPQSSVTRWLADSDEPALPQRPVTRTQQRRTRSSTPIISNGDDFPTSGSDYEDVNPPRPLTLEWRGLLSQPEFVIREPTRVIEDVPAAALARDLAEVDPSVESVDIPDVHLPPSPDPDAGRELEGGEDVNESELQVKCSKRVKKPVVRLSYDKLGKPSDYPLNVLSHGVFVGSGTYKDSRCHLCQTAWCDFMALCPDCFNRNNFNQ